MNEPSTFGYQEDIPMQPSPGPGGPLNPGHRFSPDELRVLGECNRESFYQRSMPMGTVMGLGAYAAVQSGQLKPNPKFGPFPKVALAVVMGYFLGKISYQQACADKLMALPGSYIGQLLRDRRDGKIGGTSLPRQSPNMFGATQNDIYSDAGPGSSLDLDTERPLFNDDSYRPSDSSGSSAQSPLEAPRPALSYDDLRRQNRGQYAETKQDPYRMDPSSMGTIQRPRAQVSAPTAPTPTNKYGDSME